ncbi:hypothetical protein [Pseudoalteromonas marina]|uniref:Uncharacterized protein n=1 Tax=Pseudoalteromonas marina TaxID=267375 RepID=A0ABT9FC42_9GAMM|nr:hypothetical protein [Pseudoalteromonas marina]MDP2564361.1 hypothetical protein [Pseudoalteromonas marina]
MKDNIQEDIDKSLNLAEEIISLIKINKAESANEKAEELLSLAEGIKIKAPEDKATKEKLLKLKRKLQVIMNVSEIIEKSATQAIQKQLFNDQTYSEGDIE